MPQPRTLVAVLVGAMLGASLVIAGCSKGPVKPDDFEPVGGDQALKSGKAAGTPRGAYMQSKQGGAQQKGQ